MGDRIVCHVRSANPAGNLDPGTEYVVGPDGVSEERARSLVNAGQAEWVGDDEPETATMGAGETAVESEFETATEEQPSGPGGGVEIEQNGSWYTIYVDGEQHAKVQGEEARDEALSDLE